MDLFHSIALWVGIGLSVVVLIGTLVVRLEGGVPTIHQKTIAVVMLAVSVGLLVNAFVAGGM